MIFVLGWIVVCSVLMFDSLIVVVLIFYVDSMCVRSWYVLLYMLLLRSMWLFGVRILCSRVFFVVSFDVKESVFLLFLSVVSCVFSEEWVGLLEWLYL